MRVTALGYRYYLEPICSYTRGAFASRVGVTGWSGVVVN